MTTDPEHKNFLNRAKINSFSPEKCTIFTNITKYTLHN